MFKSFKFQNRFKNQYWPYGQLFIPKLRNFLLHHWMPSKYIVYIGRRQDYTDATIFTAGCFLPGLGNFGGGFGMFGIFVTLKFLIYFSFDIRF